jgi:hypothetical protein
VVSHRTADNSPPAAVTDLTGMAGGYNYTLRGAIATQSSGDLPGFGKELAVDRNNGTMWSTPARAVMQQEFLTLDIGAVLNVGRVRLRSRTDLGEEFPKSFEFQVSSNGMNFTTVHWKRTSPRRPGPGIRSISRRPRALRAAPRPNRTPTPATACSTCSFAEWRSARRPRS